MFGTSKVLVKTKNLLR